MDEWQADVSEEPSYHVWSVSVPWCENLLKEPVETCACFCMYVAKAEREVNMWVLSQKERKEEYKHPCYICLGVSMHVLFGKKYKTQKGFPCNVHLSVSEHPLLLCFQSQWRCLLMLLIINTRKHHIPTLVPWLFCVNSRMSGKIFFWQSKQL